MYFFDYVEGLLWFYLMMCNYALFVNFGLIILKKLFYKTVVLSMGMWFQVCFRHLHPFITCFGENVENLHYCITEQQYL